MSLCRHSASIEGRSQTVLGSQARLEAAAGQAPTLRKSTRERIEEAERERQLLQQARRGDARLLWLRRQPACSATHGGGWRAEPVR